MLDKRYIHKLLFTSWLKRNCCILLSNDFTRMLVPRIDINKDGFVEEAELEIWIRHKLQKWTVHEDVDAIFRDKDMNGNDKVSWKEYMTRTFGFTEEGAYNKKQVHEQDKVSIWVILNIQKFLGQPPRPGYPGYQRFFSGVSGRLGIVRRLIVVAA